MDRHHGRSSLVVGLATAASLVATSAALASSHREGPEIIATPQVDGTDFYMFKSYEPGRSGYVTLIANYQPFQLPGGGPNYYPLNPNAVYEIHIDNNGDAQEDITFRFDFENVLEGLALPVGDEEVTVPLRQIGPIGPMATDTDNLNLRQTFTASLIRGDRRTGTTNAITRMDGDGSFRKPVDNIGNKTIPDYGTYARDHIYDVAIPGCDRPGRLFVGQRQESFYANLGETFDLVNYNPLGARDSQTSTINQYNITSLSVEVHKDCLRTSSDQPIIGGWTTASLLQEPASNSEAADRRDGKEKGRLAAAISRGANGEHGNDNQGQGNGNGNQGQGNDGNQGQGNQPLTAGTLTQVSRLGNPLVNEVVIGLPEKDRFNESEPADDAQFLTFVTNPTFPELLEILFADAGAQAPDMFPRQDLVSVFLTGVEGLNQPADVTPSEMLRLNTSIEPVPADAQDSLGVLGGDTAGFPNGRRPGDDVVDIALRVMMGALIDDAEVAPNNEAPFTDGALVSATNFMTRFPYLNQPHPGSPNEANPAVDADDSTNQ